MHCSGKSEALRFECGATYGTLRTLQEAGYQALCAGSVFCSLMTNLRRPVRCSETSLNPAALRATVLGVPSLVFCEVE